MLKPLLDRFANLDLASWSQQAGEAVAFIVLAFADGKVGDILFTSAALQRRSSLRRIAHAINRDPKRAELPGRMSKTHSRSEWAASRR